MRQRPQRWRPVALSFGPGLLPPLPGAEISPWIFGPGKLPPLSGTDFVLCLSRRLAILGPSPVGYIDSTTLVVLPVRVTRVHKGDLVIPELGRRLRGFRWKFVGMWGLIALLLGVMNYRFVDAQLDNDDALRQDMRLVVDTVASETVDHVDGFLAPAQEATALLRGVIAREQLTLESPQLETLLIEMVRARASFDGAFVGASNGSFIYARQVDDGIVLKTIRTAPEREVVLQDFDSDLNVVDERLDPDDQYDPRQRPWYLASTEGDRQWTAPYVFFSSKQPGVTFAQRPLEMRGGQTVVIGIDIRLQELSSFVDSRAPSEGAEVFIVDGSDALVAHPAFSGQELDDIPQSSAFGDPAVSLVADLVMDRDDGQLLDLEVTESFGDEPNLTVVRQSQLNDAWFVAVTAPEADFLATARAANRNALLSALIGTAIVFSVLLLLGYLIASDYRRLLGEVDDSTKSLQRRTGERDEAEAELSRTVEHLRTSNGELERYASAVTHELLTPIRAIGGYVEEAQRRLDMRSVVELPSSNTDIDVETVLDRAMTAQRNVSETVSHLLQRAIARPTAIESVPISVDDVVAGIASSHSNELIEAKATLEIPRPLGTVLLNEPTLRAAIQNLVENSLRYRRDEEDLVMTLTSTIDASDRLTLRLRDNGRGIPPDKRQTIFEAYRRADKETKGVGIGLNTVSSMLADHGATIRVNPNITHGAEFVIEMAAAVDHAPAVEYMDLTSRPSVLDVDQMNKNPMGEEIEVIGGRSRSS